MGKIKEGDKVSWKYGNGIGEGKVTEVHTTAFEKEVQGKVIKRNGTPEEPALLIKQDNGHEVVKSVSEVEKQD